MSYNQLKVFNPALGGHVAGECLKNVRLGYSIPAKYLTATAAWNATQQHHDRNIPTGISVPLFYSYNTSGHVNVRLPDGRVWSDGTYYSSLDTYLATHTSVHYLGWGESINAVSVLQYVEDPKPQLPPIGARIKLAKGTTRTTYRAGTATVAGHINVTDDTFIYVVRGYDSKYPGRILINSASAGGNGVGLALYYNSGTRVAGWTQI